MRIASSGGKANVKLALHYPVRLTRSSGNGNVKIKHKRVGSDEIG